MRILAITHNFPNEGNRNHGVFAARQLYEMKRQGADIEIIVPVVWCSCFLRFFKRWRIYNHKWKCEYKGVLAHSVPYLRLPGLWYYPLESRAAYYALRGKAIRLHRQKPFDIIYGRFFAPDGYAAWRLSKDLGIPAVAVGAGDDVNVDPSLNRWIKRDFIRLAGELDGLLASGTRAADSIRAVSCRSPLVVHGVVDLEEFTPVSDKWRVRDKLGLPQDKVIVLYIGTYKKAKGVFDMLNSFLLIKDRIPDAMFVIRGYGRQEGDMRRLVSDQQAEESVHIGDAVDHTEVAQWMQACDLFVLASHAEGMPNAVMEAMACGLPVVATAVGGLPSELNDSRGAILVEPANLAQLSDAMEKILCDGALRRQMSRASREKAEQSFGVENNARTVLQYLRQVAQEE